MFDKKLLESSELYDKRYRNFSTLIILPLFLLLIGGLTFTLFAHKELTVMSTGSIEPTKIIAKIQFGAFSKNVIKGTLPEPNKVLLPTPITTAVALPLITLLPMNKILL